METWTKRLIDEAGLLQRRPIRPRQTSGDNSNGYGPQRPPSLGALDNAFRTRLAEEWTRVAQAKHQAIASWARFVIRLQAVAAPFEFVDLASEAMQKSSQHARMCFRVAGAYAGEAVRPKSLSVQRQASHMTFEEVVLLAFNEGCVGETLALVEVGRAAQLCTDPVIVALWQRIARDTKQHAVLSWRFAKWGVTISPATATRLAEELDTTLAAQSDRQVAPEPFESRLLKAGIVTSRLRRNLRTAALPRVVAPCLSALLGQPALSNPSAIFA